jgi:GAF domain-containing protein
VTENLTPHDVVIPLILLLSHTLVAIVVIARRGLREREPRVFVIYLTSAAAWLLASSHDGLVGIWPAVPWQRVAVYALICTGVVFWDLARAFLRRPSLVAWWAPAGVAVVGLALSDVGLFVVPSLQLAGGTRTLSGEALVSLLGAAVAVAYAVAAIVTAVVEYVRRPSPLHRNRILYWWLSTVALVAGLALVFSRSEPLDLPGAGLHWLGGALLAYTIVQPQLLNIGTGVRRAAGYVLATLLPTGLVLGASLGAIFIASLRPGSPLQVTRDLLLGGAIAGGFVFLFYLPLSRLTHRAASRLLFGHSYEGQALVREYGQAVTQTLSLDEMAATAMEKIDLALGVRHGALLVVQESSATEWWLQAVGAPEVALEQKNLVLSAGTPLADWLVKRGDPLHQYTLDVDPRFASMDDDEREAWRRLSMEVYFPIGQSDSFVGLLALGLRRSRRPYSTSELRLLETLADQTAVALENASLFDRAQRQAEQLALLNEIGQVITSSLDLEPAVDLITDRTGSAFPGATGFIFLADDSEGDLVLESTFGQDVPKVGTVRVRGGQGLVGWVTAQIRPIVVCDPSRDSRYSAKIEGKLAAEARSALCVPIVARHEAVGAILLTSPSRTALGPAELNLLDSIAAFASIAIDNARQVAAREDSLRKQVAALRIEIDGIKRTEHVAKITDSDYFRELQSQARQLREEREEDEKDIEEAAREETDVEEKGLPGRTQKKLDESAEPKQENNKQKKRKRKTKGKKGKKGKEGKE